MWLTNQVVRQALKTSQSGATQMDPEVIDVCFWGGVLFFHVMMTVMLILQSIRITRIFLG